MARGTQWKEVGRVMHNGNGNGNVYKHHLMHLWNAFIGDASVRTQHTHVDNHARDGDSHFVALVSNV